MRPLVVAVSVGCLFRAVALPTVVAQSASRAASPGEPRPYTTWSSYLGGAHSAQFTALNQITTSNVSRLAVAWSFPAGNRTFLFNPLVADGLAFVLAGANDIVALDPATGKTVFFTRCHRRARQAPARGRRARRHSWGRPQLERVDDRRDARHRLRALPVCQQHRRARRENGQAALALPGRSSDAGFPRFRRRRQVHTSRSRCRSNALCTNHWSAASPSSVELSSSPV